MSPGSGQLPLTSAGRHPFTDLVSGRACALVITGGHAGVAHPGCSVLADLALVLDAFYCPACKWNGRVSGAWCADLIQSGHA